MSEPATAPRDDYAAGYDAARKQAEQIVNTSSSLLQAAARIRRMTSDDAQ